jgi:hypothetical protein
MGTVGTSGRCINEIGKVICWMQTIIRYPSTIRSDFKRGFICRISIWKEGCTALTAIPNRTYMAMVDYGVQ